MGDYVVIGIIAVAVVIGIISSVKHFKGEGGCCGGSSYKPKKKKLLNVKYQKTFIVGGMHCENCKRRVEETVNDIKNVAGKIDLKKGELTVFYADDVDDGIIKEKIERAGYTVNNK